MSQAQRRSSQRLAARLLSIATTSLLISASLVLTAAPQSAQADYASECAAPTRTVAAGDTSISVGATETVLIASDFTGGVDALPAGATLCVGPGATFNGYYLNNPSGALLVAPGATLVLPSVAVNTGFSLEVEGTATLAGMSMNGNASVLVAAGATLTFSGSVSSAAGVFTNNGVLRIEGAFNVNSGVAVDNTGVLSVLGMVTVSGPMTNSGLANFSLGLTINSSGSLDNSCAVNSLSDVINNSATSTNSGVVLASGSFLNNGTWTQAKTGALSAAGLTNDGSVLGFGRYKFTANSSVQGTFAGDSAADPIVVQSTATPPAIFNVQTGTVVNTVSGAVNVLFPLPTCGVAPIAAEADVEAAKSGPATVLANGLVSYTIIVTNWGPDDAEDVVVTDTLPSGFALDPSSTTATAANGMLTWQLGTLTAGSSTTLTFSGTATAPVGDILHNVVSSTSSTLDLAPLNNDGSSSSSQVDTKVVADPPPANSPPVAEDLIRDTTTGALLVSRLNATDPDVDQELTFTATTRPSHGRYYFSAGGGLVYVSDRDFSGVDTFTYEVCDNGSPVECDQATVTINVYPRAVDDAALTFVDTPVTIAVLSNDTQGAPLQSSVVTAPSNGQVTLDPATGQAMYTPNAGYLGTDTFEYSICSPTAPSLCDVALVTVTIEPENHPPVIDPLTLVTDVETPIGDTITATDPDTGDSVAVHPGIPPRSGTVTVGQDGATVYTPVPGYAGRDFYTVIACDDGTPEMCSTGRVNVEVYPIAEPDAATTPAGAAVDVDVTPNDAGSVEAPSIDSPPSNGSVTFLGGVARYVPAAGFSGTDSFTYTICAINAPDLCSTATVTITVTPANVIPPVDPDDGSNGGQTGGGGIATTGANPALPFALASGALLAGMVLLSLRRRLRRAE